MKKRQLITILLLSIFIFSCKEKSEKTQLIEKVEKTQLIEEVEKTQLIEKVENLEPKINLNELETDFIKWWTYHSYNISLSSNFTALNEQSDTIEKKQFLEKLTTSNYIPLRLESNEGSETYKLFKLDSSANKSIGNTMKNESLTSLEHYNMERLTFPKFDFIDLNGNLYTNEKTKGKL